MTDSNRPLTKSTISVQASLESIGSPAQTAAMSVEQLNIYIKQLLEGQMGVVWVRGEVSNFKAHSSGHFYFSLKDSRSQITAVMFRGNNMRLKFKPHDGLEVIARARVTVYEPRGNYQLLVDSMEPVGAGALQKAFEQLKEKLKNEGLFEASRKKPLPLMPQKIAIVTSPTGAAIRDILNILSRRARSIEVIVVPTVVQGEAAIPSLREAFKKAVSIKDVDAVIVGRGGGSIEDMWCFNDEGLARLIAGSPVPVISAVGHEIDFTIADFVADVRAPTPSAAAELVSKSSQELTARLSSMDRLLALSMQRRLQTWTEKVLFLKKNLIDPKRKLQDLSLRNDDLVDRLERAWSRRHDAWIHRVTLLRSRLSDPQKIIEKKRLRVESLQSHQRQIMLRFMEKKRSSLEKVMGVMDSLSPLRVVDRGYSIVTKNKKVVKSVKDVFPQDVVEIQVTDGIIKAEVKG